MSVFLRKYNTLLVTGSTAIRIPIVKRSSVDFAVSADWTPAAGDVKIHVNGTAAANVTNLPTAVTSGNTAVWEFILTAAELSCQQAMITVCDSATKAVEDQAFIVETYGHASARYQADLSLANLPANMTQILGTAVSSPATAGILDVNVKNIDNDAASASGTVTFPNATLASTTNITAGTITTATNVTTVNGLAANVITAASMAADASAEIADAVWDEDATAHQTGGTFGQAIGDPGADTNTIFKAVVTDATGATVGVDVVALKAETVNILADTAEIGAAGAGLTAINLPDQTMNITGDITGNLSGSVGSVTGNVGGNVTGSVGSVVAAVAITSNIKKNQALAAFEFLLTDSTTHLPVTGKAVTATRSLDGAAFAACANAVTEVGSGIYTINLAAADLNANVVTLHFTAATTDDLNITIVTVP